ncbi:MAG: phosphate ABC transporter permease PstA [Rhodospirillaceae bacterium]|nr:MAG: phosphate ABC transporter permease PstA [Rhodospirillaceae bacterium]
MNETATIGTHQPTTSPHMSDAAARRRAARRRGELVFRTLGLAALGLAALFLIALMFSVFKKSYNGFVQSFVTIEVPLDASIVDPEDLAQYQASVGIAEDLWAADITPSARDAKSASRKVLRTAAYKKMIEAMIDQDHGSEFTGYEGDRARKKAISQTAGMISTGTLLLIRDRLISGEYRLGETVSIVALASGDADVLFKDMKRQTQRNVDSENWILLKESIDENGLSVLKAWRDGGQVSIRPYLGTPRLDLLGWTILERRPGFFGSASSTQPERAGIAAAAQGTFLMLLVVVILSVPVGVLAAVYLEKFAPRNQFTDFMEININNLAAVPSIIFGILGAAVIIQWLFPGSRGFPIVGGTVLSFMTLPTVIIAARAAIGAVPPSYEQAALGMGASRQQAVFQHVLPAALPGIASGVIIGLAQAAGETAPLLMVGMNAFIKDVCEAGAGCLMSKGVAMPSQIYQWAADDDPLFQNKTAAGIVCLLALVISMNALATFIRARFERSN